jgi:hypothetical protein
MGTVEKQAIGALLSPVLEGIEGAIIDHEMLINGKTNYTKDGFRAAIKIFMSAVMDKMWELQDKEDMTMEQRGEMATHCGESLRQFVKTYTDIDTYDLYK